MTEKEMLELILTKVTNLENNLSSLSSDVASLKRQEMKHTAELKAMDEVILDEVERVHRILDKHKEDKTVHSA